MYYTLSTQEFDALLFSRFSMASNPTLLVALLLTSGALSAAAPATVISQRPFTQLIKRVFFGDTKTGPCAVNGSNYLDIKIGPGSGAFVIGE
jgi:hypothetical protein